MKKFATALAAAAAMGSISTAHAYEWQVNEDTYFSLYGSFELLYVNQQREVDEDTGEVNGVNELLDNGSTFGVEGEHAFNDALTGFFRAEFEYRADEKEGDEGIADTDEVFVGLKGDFGKVQIGTWDGIYEDSISDLTDVFEYDSLTESEDFRTGEVGDAVAYFTPTFSGFSLEVQGFFKGEGEGDNFDDNPGADSGQAYQAVAKYTADRFAVHLGYDNNGLNENADGTIGLGGQVDLSPFTLSARYELIGEDEDAGRGEISAYGLAGEYDYGPGSVILGVQQIDPDEEDLDSRTEFGINVNYAVADNLYVYAEHVSYDAEEDLGNYTGIGTVYEF